MKIENLRQSLRQKGWPENDIERALNIVKYGKSNQKNFLFVPLEYVYWIALFVSIIGNIILSVLIIPFLVVLKHQLAYVSIILFAFGFGYIFYFLLKDIEVTDPRHHVISGIFIPAIAVIDIYIVVNLTNYFLVISKLNQTAYNPFLITIAYLAAFILPYIYFQIPHLVENFSRKTYKSE